MTELMTVSKVNELIARAILNAESDGEPYEIRETDLASILDAYQDLETDSKSGVRRYVEELMRQLLIQSNFMRAKAATEVNHHLHDVDQPESGGGAMGDMRDMSDEADLPLPPIAVKEITVKLHLDMSMPGARENIARLLELLYRTEAEWEASMTEHDQAMLLDPVEFSMVTKQYDVDSLSQTGKSIVVPIERVRGNG